MNKKLLLIAALMILLLGAFCFLKNTSTKNTDQASESKNQTLSALGKNIPSPPVASPQINGSVPYSADTSAPSKVPRRIELTSGNFESYVRNCFEGEACRFADDPKKMYEDFKQAGNQQANDNLIAFLRSKLKDVEFRDRYKNILKIIIDDFYSDAERPFQEAAYYNYLGDLEKSLALYKDIEKRQGSDPSLRPAPKLNIANTLYDLGRFKEALPYYEAALKEYISGAEQTSSGQSDMIRFIEGRIESIQAKI